MKKIVPIIIFLFGGIVNAQIWQNMIPNYSFENHNISNWNADSGCGNNPPIWDYTYIIDYWSVIDEWTHPLRHDPCLSFVPVATADLYHTSCRSSNDSRSGETWGYTKTKEVLVVPTRNYVNGGLQAGKKYFIEVFNSSSASEGLHIVGYERQPEICGYPNNNKWMHQTNKNKKHAQVYLSFDATSTIPYSQPSGWTRYKGYFSPITNKRWLSLGSSGTWDDIRIYEVQPNGCRDNWYFDNTVFNYPTEFFQAGNNIYVGKGMDPEDGINHIAGEVRILNGSHAILQAGNQVILGDGFTMEPGGSRLLVENQPCSDGLCPNTISFTDQLICDQPGKLIGDSNVDYWGTSVSWSPADHLDDPTSANPYFTTPAGAGVVDYTVTVNYTCDTGFEYTQSFPVTVQYSNSSDLTASISVTNTDEGTEHFTADFSISEGVTEITINQLGMPFYSETFYRGVDFSGTTFHWEMPDGWLTGSCQDSYFSVEAVNGCSDASQTIQLPWEKDYQGIIEFEHQWDPEHAPNCCVINMYDGFCFYTEFADSYELAVFGPSGSISPIHTSSGAITSNTMCIWNGEGLDPYYYDNFAYPQSYHLTLYNVCGQELYKHGYVVVTTGTKSANGNQRPPSKGEKYEREIQELTSGNERLLLFPNPNKGSFQVQLPAFETPGTLQVRDFTGRIIYEEMPETTEVTCELNAAAGTYFLHWQNDNKNEVIRFVIE